MIVDIAGTVIGPTLVPIASKYGIPLLLLLTCAKAESGMDPHAFRNGVWPDVSCGPYQQTVEFAKGYGIGDGSSSLSNIQICQKLFSDWELSSEVAAQHLKDDYASASRSGAWKGDDVMIAALSRYNSGSLQPPGDWWWGSYQCAGYRTALAWAHQCLGE